jgi:endonuclease YncB( thermonuclease family)
MISMLKRHYLSIFAVLWMISTSLALANGTFTGKVVGVSDGDTISIMHEGRGEGGKKRGLWVDENPIPPWEWRRGRR